MCNATRSTWPSSRITRLTASGGLGSLIQGQPAGATPTPNDAVRTRYAVLFDTHVTPREESYVASCRRVLDHLAARDPAPDFVLHAGDVTNTGFPVEWALYDSLIPDRLRDRIHHIPGNHEVRWDAGGNREFHRRFPAPPYAFDCGPLHIVGLDGTQLLQEIANIGQPQLAWLAEDLGRVGPDRPVVLFNHFPVGDLNYFVLDQDAFYDVIAGSNVVMVHAGHIHRDSIVTHNGFTQVSGAASRDEASFHWVEVSGDALSISLGVVDADGQETLTDFYEVPLAKSPAFSSGIPSTTVRARNRDVVDVSVDASGLVAASGVDARFWPYSVHASKDAEQLGWHDLELGDGSWRGALLSTDLAPGGHRVEVRAYAGETILWQYTRDVSIPATRGEMEERWRIDLGASIQAGVVSLPGVGHSPATVVVATSMGAVHGIEPKDREARVSWSVDLMSPVIGTPGVAADGAVFVGTVGHGVAAINGYTGERVWTWRHEAAVLGSLCLGRSEDAAALLVPSGSSLYALDSRSGALRWTADVGGFVGGRPVADANAVFCESGDGTVRALDLTTGSPLWQATIFEDPTRHRRLLYSGWSHFTTLMAVGEATSIVIAATVEATFAIDGMTGDVLWSRPLGTMYAAALLNGGPEPALIAVTEQGDMRSIVPNTGETIWEAALGYRVMNSSPLERDGFVYVPGTGGQITALSVTTGDVVARYQVGPSGLLGTPAFSGDVMVVADTDGVVRGIVTSRVGA